MLDKPAGPPTQYRPEFAAIAWRMRRQRLPTKMIAAALGVSVRTTARWRVKYKEFRRAIKVPNEKTQSYVMRSR
jgi:hypothetical protein